MQNTHIDKRAYSIKEAAHRVGICRDGIYRAIRQGELAARKCGHRTLILDTDLDRYLDELPHATPSTDAE